MRVPADDTLSVGVDGDRELLEALQRGDAFAAECLVARHGGRAYRVALGITGDSADADEIVEDAFSDVIERIEAFRGCAALSARLYRTVITTAYERASRAVHRRTEPSLEEVRPSADWSEQVGDPALRSDLRLALGAAIDELSPEYRTAVVLHDVETFSMAEVAESMEITIASAKTYLHCARLFLRNRLATFMATAGADRNHRPSA